MCQRALATHAAINAVACTLRLAYTILPGLIMRDNALSRLVFFVSMIPGKRAFKTLYNSRTTMHIIVTFPTLERYSVCVQICVPLQIICAMSPTAARSLRPNIKRVADAGVYIVYTELVRSSDDDLPAAVPPKSPVIRVSELTSTVNFSAYNSTRLYEKNRGQVPFGEHCNQGDTLMKRVCRSYR
eukprot:COSAG02_NODE_12232_length_1576_cov_1.607989_2_plen_185_part_00